MQRQAQVFEGYRLSPQQKHVWRLQQDSQAYCAQCAILIEGDLNSELLEEALKKIMQKHEVLRTALDWIPGLDTPIQLILERPPLPFRKVDLVDRESERLELAVGDLCREESRPFDLKRGLLARFCLGRLSESRQVLLISLHALCADGRTLRNLFREIGRFYAAELEGEELSNEVAQYLQFSEWQNELLEEESAEIESRDQEITRPIPALVLPFESTAVKASESPRRQFSPESVASTLDSRVTGRIETITHQRSSVPGFLLACWQILLWSHGGEDEIITDCLIDGREFEELHDALGLFARYVPARGTLGRDLRFDEAVERSVKSLQQAYASREFFLREMADGQATSRVRAIGFEYEEWPEAAQIGPVRFSYWRRSVCIDRFKLKLCGYRKAENLTIEIQYDPVLFSRESIELIHERYLRLIENAVEHEQALIGDLEIVGRREPDGLYRNGDLGRRLAGGRSAFERRIDGEAAAGSNGKIGEEIRAGEMDEAPPLVRVSRSGRLPLSFAQQRLWFLDQLAPNNPFYNIPGTVRLEGEFDLEALEGAINEIIRRHEVLRTRFEVVENEPVQVIDQWEYRKLEVVDLTGLTQEEREDAARRMVTEEAGTGFDLRRGPLLRVKVLKLEEADHLVIYIMHHIVSDGWSRGIMIGEVGALYRAYHALEPSPLPELEIQYADYAVWQRNWLQGAVLERHLSYWREQLAGVTPLELPTDYPRPSVAHFRGAGSPISLSPELTQDLMALSRSEGVTLFMTLLAAFQTVLMRYSGQEEIAVGSPIANRTRSETEALIGFFVNTLVLRTRIEGKLSFEELLRRVREVCLGAYAHQDLPFEQLVKHLQPERDLSHQPLFQVALVLQNAPVGKLELSGLRLSNLDIPFETSKFDLLLDIFEAPDRLGGHLNYNSDLFEAATIERLIAHLKVVLREVVARPREPISEISYLTAVERRQILREWNDTWREYPTAQCLHRLFEQQVEAGPEAVAVVFEAEYLSYRELNRRSNQLAHELREKGVGPEELIGLCLAGDDRGVVGNLEGRRRLRSDGSGLSRSAPVHDA